MPRLKVVHVVAALGLDSVADTTLYTVTHLNPSLFETALISGPGGMLDEDVMLQKDFSVRFCGDLSRSVRPIADFQAYQRLREIIKELKPDIIHTHSTKAGVLGRLAASAENVSLIVHSYHGFGFHLYQNAGVFRLSVALEKEACRRSRHLIFDSRENASWAEQLGLIQKCSTSLIRRGVEIDTLLKAQRTESFREKHGIPRKAKVIGMIAALKPQRDPLTFVEAADLVSQKNSDVKFLLVGDGELADAVRRRVAKMRYPNSFAHLGWRRDVPEIICNLDLLVAPSLWAGMSRVIAEATIAGVPVVASDVDGTRELVFEGDNGTLAERRNPQDFAEKIQRAIVEDWKVNPDISQQMQHEFDIRAMVHQLETLYVNLAAVS
jgi:glycosyltransferase involved in cell wall biosynthesis